MSRHFFNRIYKNSLLIFILIGGLGSVTNLLVFSVFISFGVTTAAIAAYIVAVSQNYVLNQFWNFHAFGNKTITTRRYLKYFSVNLFGLLVNLTVLHWILLNLPGTQNVIAQFVGILSAAVFNYLGARFIVFSAKKYVDKW